MSPLAELLPHHAFIDLETTGLDPSCDEVIEVGVVFVERGEIVGRLSHLCRPSVPLPLVIRRITGLDDHTLASRSKFRDLLPQLADALRGWTLVAHNASFERGFLGKLLADIHAPVLDSCELMHYLHPELPSHSLRELVRWAKLGDGTVHRARQDAEDTFHVLGHALTRCLDEARHDDVADLVSTLAPSDGELAFDDAHSPLVSLLRRLLHQLKHRPGRLTLTPSHGFLPPPENRRRVAGATIPATVDGWLGDEGALEQRLPGFTARPAQLELAQAVERTLRDGGTLGVEAATGTGKSLGYLAAAALTAVKRGSKVAVAPHTRALQDQLVHGELPRLHEASGGAFSFAVLKGQSNYFCRRRALEATESSGELSMGHRAARAYLRAFMRHSPDGDLDRLSAWFRDRFPALDEVVSRSRSEASSTLGETCPHYTRCAYHSAVAHARAADVLVVNQSLALQWPARYPPLDAVIFDEAHELEDTATQVWSDELTDARLGALIERLAGARGLATALRREVSSSFASELTTAASHAMADLHQLGDALTALVPPEPKQLPFELRLAGETRTTRGWLRVRDAMHSLRGSFDEVTRVLTARLAEAAPMLVSSHPALQRDVDGALALVAETIRLLESIADRPDGHLCHELQVRERGWAMASRPIEVHERFRREVVGAHRSVVLTSATLSVGPDAPWVLERLGLMGGERPTPLLRLGGGFDVRGQALVMLVTDAPDPQTEGFLEWAAQRLSGLSQYLAGRVLGLFASTRRLEAVSERLRPLLEPHGIEVLKQSRGAARQLAARQKEDLGTVLLGTKTFWQGIDIPGLGVSCVFIDKLPLEPANRPIVEAREERLGGEPWGFLNYRLPRALIQLRQGVGRLIRSPDDRGVVLIADPGSPVYRAKLYEALEGYRVEALPWAQARLRLYQAMKRMGIGGVAPRPSQPEVRAPQQWSLFDKA